MSDSLQTDGKTERLLNLVLALFGTRRFLKKSEILDSIPGYEGSAEAKERMFERDKDELRKIGIEIEVSQMDPLFEDEVGYRISRDQYVMKLPTLTPEEGILANLAFRLIARIGIGADVRSALMRMRANSILENSTIEQIFAVDDLLDSHRTLVISTCLAAIRTRNEIIFEYQKELDGTTHTRHVKPLRLEIRDDQWHLVAWDESRNAGRAFLIDNFVGIPVIAGSTFHPDDIPPVDPGDVPFITFRARTLASCVPALELEGGVFCHSDESHSYLEFRVYNVERILRLILAIDPRVEISEPPSLGSTLNELRTRMINAL